MFLFKLTVTLLMLTHSSKCFIPHPFIRFAGRTTVSATHKKLTKKGFARSLLKFVNEKSKKSYVYNEKTTLKELVKAIYNGNEDRVKSCAIFSVLDLIARQNAFQDIRKSTKKLPSVHFDAEEFDAANERLMRGRKKIFRLVSEGKLLDARIEIGKLLHTLQDFYSHSNWIELGFDEPNYALGIDKFIGKITPKYAPACNNEGCKLIEKQCNLWQKLTIRKCPLVYFDCHNNIDENVMKEKLLTSGYSINQRDENDVPIEKPTDVLKCSHGGIFDSSSYKDAVGGINKDSIDVLYSPHHYLHFKAARVAILATEFFFDNLRQVLGDKKFAELFFIVMDDSEKEKQLLCELISQNSCEQLDEMYENETGDIENAEELLNENKPPSATSFLYEGIKRLTNIMPGGNNEMSRNSAVESLIQIARSLTSDSLQRLMSDINDSELAELSVHEGTNNVEEKVKEMMKHMKSMRKPPLQTAEL